MPWDLTLLVHQPHLLVRCLEVAGKPRGIEQGVREPVTSELVLDAKQALGLPRE